MAELEKVIRVIRKLDAEAPHATLLVLDATVGQNALSQVEIFQKAAGVTGLVMTKLDGTARGGILVALAAKFGLPVHFIGSARAWTTSNPSPPATSPGRSPGSTRAEARIGSDARTWENLRPAPDRPRCGSPIRRRGFRRGTASPRH